MENRYEHVVDELTACKKKMREQDKKIKKLESETATSSNAIADKEIDGDDLYEMLMMENLKLCHEAQYDLGEEESEECILKRNA